MDNQERMDQLFNLARKEPSGPSFDRTRERFVTATGTILGLVILYKLLKTVSLKTWIIMTSSMTLIATTATVLVLNTNTTQPIEQPQAEAPKAPVEITEVSGTNFPDMEHKVVSVVLTEPEKETEEAVVEQTIRNLDSATQIFEERATTLMESDTFILSAPTAEENTSAEVIPEATAEKEAAKEYSRYEFRVTHKTTEVELLKISETAKEAGIDFTYKASMKNDQIRRLSIEMKIGEQASSDISAKGDAFTIRFGWETDDQGKAVKFLDNSCKVNAKHQHHRSNCD